MPSSPTPASLVERDPSQIVSTGAPGLDAILDGGLDRGRMVLLEGEPGTGKTTLALQFVRDGISRGERVLYVTLSQRRDELEQIAASHGWSLDGIEIADFETEGLDIRGGESSLFHPGEVELPDVMDTILRRVEEVVPDRLVLDSAAEVRLLAGEALRARRRFLLLKQSFGQEKITTLVLNDGSGEAEGALHSIMHGVIHIGKEAPAYGEVYRRVHIPKMRGVEVQTGYHDARIRTGGLEVYPSLDVPSTLGRNGRPSGEVDQLSSGVASVDEIIGGGLDFGASCVLLGVAGSGKSSLAALYALAGVKAGKRAAIYTFDERRETLLLRMAGLGLDLQPGIEAGKLAVHELSASIMTSGRFTDLIRHDVEAGVRVVVIDSMTGFLRACPHSQRSVTRLHDLLGYLGDRGVLTLLTVPQHGLLGAEADAQLDVSYLADTVLLLRYYEAQGELHKAIAVVKRRRGAHANEVRQLIISAEGICVGDEIEGYQGILTGVPMLGGSS